MGIAEIFFIIVGILVFFLVLNIRRAYNQYLLETQEIQGLYRKSFLMARKLHSQSIQEKRSFNHEKNREAYHG